MASELADRKCIPCNGDTPPLADHEIESLLTILDSGWQLNSRYHLSKVFRFRNFREAIGFTNKIGEIAEELGHHPDIYLAWGKVEIEIWTHVINGLSENDFILAAKIDKLLG
jgi:4a-hydroxytetrahydrobiopterin dehydratase